MLRTIPLLFLFLALFSSCNRTKDEIKPQLTYQVSDWHVQRLPSAFEPLTTAETDKEWGKEYRIGLALAKELDLYRAVTAFKRAELLAPIGSPER